MSLKDSKSTNRPSNAPESRALASGDDGADQRPAARLKRALGEVLKLLRQADLPALLAKFRKTPPAIVTPTATVSPLATAPPLATVTPPATVPDGTTFSQLFLQPDLPALLAKFRHTPPVTVPDGAAYLPRTFACEAGSRDYKLYVPSHLDGRKLPLIIMLHGCTQTPDDFAVGTRMNQLAEEHGLAVAYPRQPTNANQLACWNWFNPNDQMRDSGEPSIIAGITCAIMAELKIDAERVFVAGLSAGGAMAEIMSATYPELYAAIGIHSGLAYGSATDAASASAAMSGASSPVAPPRKRRLKKAKGTVRTIVFHGASDHKVNPSNGELILAEARADLAGTTRETQHHGSAGGLAYTRTVIVDANGVPQVEHWAIEGLGHAWSGGCPDGSYTDRHGPDASREMLRFFFGNPDAATDELISAN